MSSILPALTRLQCLPDHAGRMAVSISIVERCWHDVCIMGIALNLLLSRRFATASFNALNEAFQTALLEGKEG
jgi:hypothetical protein